jgi:hypothetical protein
MPVLLILLGAIADGGRAFYYSIASQNVAREAAHWATIVSTNSADAGVAPTDTDIVQHVATPSQESFGIGLSLAPPDIANSSVPLNANTAANPGFPDTPLAGGQSWLFVYPNSSGRTALLPGQHWKLVAVSSQIVPGDSPATGGLAAAMGAASGGLVPMDVEAASHCYTWTGVSLSASSFTVGPGTPYGPLTLVATVNGIAGNGTASNTITLAVTANPPAPAFPQTWTSTGAATGSLNPKNASQDTVTLTNNVPASAGTYTYTVAASSSGGGCSQPTVSKSFTITVQPTPSPSPSPSPSPLPSISPSPIPTPDVDASAASPKGHSITCTVIYYFRPLTPLISTIGFYIVGVATMQATY